jgi:hypothetical protein
MAAIAHTTDYLVGDGEALPARCMGKSFVLKTTIECAEVLPAQNEVMRIWDIPAGTFVERVIANVTTAEGHALTFDVGDYLDADDEVITVDGYIDGADGNTVAVVNDTDEAYAAGKLYRAKSWIGIKMLDVAPHAAVIDLILMGWKC